MVVVVQLLAADEDAPRDDIGARVLRAPVAIPPEVADAVDDGAAYAIAQGIRSTVGALVSANQQLGNSQGLLATTMSGLPLASRSPTATEVLPGALGEGSTTGPY